MEKENTNIVPINKEINVVKYETKNIKDLIYTIRGKQVMLDSDVAMLYHCETRIINQAVKRNIDRFPDRYCFQLTRSEFENLNNGKVIRKYLPYVFTEQGIAMLSGLLKNEIAIQVSINIMDAFVEMRKIIANNFNINNRVSTLEYQMIECHEKFDEVFNELQKGKDTEIRSTKSRKFNINKKEALSQMNKNNQKRTSPLVGKRKKEKNAKLDQRTKTSNI